MKQQVPNGNVNVVFILSVILVAMIILLFVLFFMYLRFKKRSSVQIAHLSGELQKTYTNFNIFMANLSREIRSHMISVMGNDEIILRDSIDNSIRENAGRIKTSSEDVISLMQGVIDFMRIGTGDIEFAESDYDLASFIIDIVTTVSPNLKNKEVILNVSADRDCPRNIVGDPHKIRSSLINLFSFIGKNMNSKGTVDFEIGFERVDSSNANIKFRINCNGLIPENSKIEGTILQTPSENKLNFSSSDNGFLELFLSGAILVFMNSKLTFRENDKNSKEFSFTISVGVKGEDIVGDIRDIGHERKIRNFGKVSRIDVFGASILLVDDNKDNILFFKQVLEFIGVSLKCANNAEEALDLIRKDEFDMFLLREGVCDSKDCEIIKRIRGGQTNPLNSHKPCIAMCYDETPDKTGDVHLKYDDFLVVPASPNDIEEILIKYLPENKYQITNDSGAYPQIHGIEDIRKYSEGYEDLFRNAMSIYKRAANYRKTDNK